MNRKARRASAANIRRSETAEPSSNANYPAALRLVAADAALKAGNMHFEAGELEQALDFYVRAIEFKPDALDAHGNFCAVLLAQGQFEAVSAHVEQLLLVRPDYLKGHQTLIVALLGAGQTARAFDALLRALSVDESPEIKSLFIVALRSAQSTAIPATMTPLLTRALTEPWGRPDELVRPAVNVLKNDETLGSLIARAAQLSPARVSAQEIFGDDPAALFRNALLRALLQNAKVHDLALERYLTCARRVLLEDALAATGAARWNEDQLAFYCALARQCFINEYIYDCSDAEERDLQVLHERLLWAVEDNGAISPIWIAALAAFTPLHAIPALMVLLEQPWPQPLDAVLTQQLRHPAQERALKASIPHLTPIADDVSRLVRDQYEENPYPRWAKSAPVGRPQELTARLRSQFPLAKIHPIDDADNVDVLVAGCGTGQQLVDVTQRIAKARVLAVDLSLASLAYAKRQTQALGLTDIEFGQADILQLGTLNRRFDAIDCGGVLHHLAEPEAGWRVLTSLLRDHGFMRIALYSAVARRHVTAARAFIAERGYTSTAQDIRRFRQDVLALADDDPVKLVAKSPDFYSLSDCRDLAFHVQEQCFTLPRIRSFLNEQNLEFLGFEVDLRIASRYRARFPDDRACTDLDNWHAFEESHPGSFGGMYQFWLQRR